MLSPTKKWNWLVRNAGRYRITEDNSLWTKPNGEKFKPLVNFSFDNVSFSGKTLDEAVTAAMEYEKTKEQN